jgi:hypothetical protein
MVLPQHDSQVRTGNSWGRPLQTEHWGITIGIGLRISLGSTSDSTSGSTSGSTSLDGCQASIIDDRRMLLARN